MYRIGWEQTSGHIWLGHGTNTFGQFNPVLDDQGQVIYGRLGGYLGSFPLSVLYDTGVIGVLLVLGWLGSHHRAAFRWSRAPRAPRRLWSFAFASVLMFTTFFTSDGTLLSFPWVHMGMTTILLRIARRTSMSSTSGVASANVP